MKPDLFAYSPMSFFAVAMTAAVEANKAAQDTVTNSMERAAKSQTPAMNWVQMSVPVPNAAFYFDEELMRESFQKMADRNLRQWEIAAEMLQTLPGWANWTTKVPGPMMTDMFDRMRRASASMMPANDTWKTAAENFSPPNFFKTAPAGPALMDAPDGAPDDLTEIKGIGPKLSTMLNELGIFHFSQIAAWSDADGEWIDDQLAFKGRVARENWIAQAKTKVAELAA